MAEPPDPADRRVTLDPGLEDDEAEDEGYTFANLGEHRSTTKAVWQMHGVSAKVSLTLLFAGSVIGTIGVIACWMAFLIDKKDRFAPGSISEMVHRKGSEENDIFMLFGLGGLLLLGSHFSLRLSNCVIPESLYFGAILNAARFLGTSLGAAMVAFVPTKEAGEFGVGVGVHMGSAVLLFASGLIPEMVLLWNDHPVLSQPEQAENRLTRIIFVSFSSVCSAAYFAVEGYKMANTCTDCASSVGPTNSALHTTTFLLEVYVGIALLMLHALYWHSAPERIVSVVPKTRFVMRTYIAFMILIFVSLSAWHIKKVMGQSMKLATARFLCAEESSYECLKCKDGVSFDHEGECTVLSNDEVYWTQLLIPQLAATLDVEGIEPNDVITHTMDKAEARAAKWLKYHVCRVADGGHADESLEVYTGFLAPDLARLDLEALGLAHLAAGRSPLGPGQRFAMTIACKDPVNDWPKFLKTDADSQNLNATLSELGFECLSMTGGSWRFDGRYKDIQDRFSRQTGSELDHQTHMIARGLWKIFMIENGLAPGEAAAKLDQLVPPELQSVAFRQLSFSHSRRFIDPGFDMLTREKAAAGARSPRALNDPGLLTRKALCATRDQVFVGDVTGDGVGPPQSTQAADRKRILTQRKRSLPIAEVNNVLAAADRRRISMQQKRSLPIAEVNRVLAASTARKAVAEPHYRPFGEHAVAHVDASGVHRIGKVAETLAEARAVS